MKKTNKIMIWFVTICFVLSMVAVVTDATQMVQWQTEESCYSRLQEATRELADDFYRSAEMDQMILNAMSMVIASEEEPTDYRLCTVMNSYGSIESYINYVEILRPDDQLLDSNGETRDVSGSLSFEEEVKKGSYISEVTWSTRDPEEKIIRNAVPILVDGETVGILYGVIRLSCLKETYTTDIYDGNAYVYLVEGATGDMMFDTWHSTDGNISDFYDRECLSEDSFMDAAEKMRRDQGGSLTFRSKSTGDIQYMHYEPIGINGWIVCTTIQDRYAFASSLRVQEVMRQMTISLSIIVVFYLLFVCFIMLQAYRRIKDVGLNDRITGLQNRNAYDAFLSQNRKIKLQQVTCVYMDANGLHELNNQEGHAAGDRMLSRIAEVLKQEFPLNSIYRVGGDEFVMISTEMSEDICREKTQKVHKILEEQHYSVAYGIAEKQNAIGLEEVVRLADEQMLEHKKTYYSIQKRNLR